MVYNGPGGKSLRIPPKSFSIIFLSRITRILRTRDVLKKRHTDEATGGIAPPELTYDIFARCMDYARSVEWGKAFRGF